MNKKILALDLDDTLLQSDKSISQKTLDAMNDMLAVGHIIAIDSGRPIFGMKPVTDQYDIFKKENVYLLGIQGGLGYYPYEDRVLFYNLLQMDRAKELAYIIKDAGFTFLGFDDSVMYVFELNDEAIEYNKHSDSTIVVINDESDFDNIKLCKIICCSYSRSNELLAFHDDIKAKTEDVFESMFSCPMYLEFINKGTDKGKGLAILAEYLNIPIENTIACGDERNDISMIKVAGVGVAVANAAKEAKDVADYITEADNNNHAIAEVINKFIL